MSCAAANQNDSSPSSGGAISARRWHARRRCKFSGQRRPRSRSRGVRWGVPSKAAHRTARHAPAVRVRRGRSGPVKRVLYRPRTCLGRSTRISEQCPSVCRPLPYVTLTTRSPFTHLSESDAAAWLHPGMQHVVYARMLQCWNLGRRGHLSDGVPNVLPVSAPGRAHFPRSTQVRVAPLHTRRPRDRATPHRYRRHATTAPRQDGSDGPSVSRSMDCAQGAL